MKYTRHYLLTLILVFILTACGGGSAGNNTQDAAVAKVEAYATSNGTSLTPTLQDYIDIGVTGINSSTKLTELNQMVSGLTAVDVDTAEEIQALANTLNLVVVDVLPPVIILNGQNPVTVAQFSYYTDAGATAIDLIDGNVNVTSIGSVNTNIVGDYNITYSAIDIAGNVAAEIIRTVNVEDTTAPVITLIGANPQTIEVGGTYNELGASTDDNSTVVIVTIAVKTNVEGNYTVTYNATDGAGNVATEVIRTVNVKIFPLTITSTAPSISVIECKSVPDYAVITAQGSGVVSYALSGIDASYFELNSTMGIVKMLEKPNFKAKKAYSYSVIATDVGTGEQVVQAVDYNVSEFKITHNDFEYGCITDQNTTRVWLDRNINAPQSCTSATDSSCSGGYFQWGREADGHEDLTSSTTATKETSLSSNSGIFVINATTWLATSVDDSGSIREENWSKTDGSSVCPVGFRVPTETEFNEEKASWDSQNTSGAFSALKLSLTSLRSKNDGTLLGEATSGAYWTTTYSTETLALNQIVIHNRNRLFTIGTTIQYFDAEHSYGASVRCIAVDERFPELPATAVFTSVTPTNTQTECTPIADYTPTVENATGTITYTLVGQDSGHFTINASTGLVHPVLVPDYETKTSQNYTIKASDSATRSSIRQDVTHTITDYDFLYNGLHYGCVASNKTGRVWLDRNLACGTFSYLACKGGLFQWGRPKDGHELITSGISNSTRAYSITPGDDVFRDTSFYISVNNSDWIQPTVDESGDLRITNWSKTDGTSVCPVGYRVATQAEWDAEQIMDWQSGTLPFAGYIKRQDGVYNSVGSYYWTLNPNVNRAEGRSVRCIKDGTL